LTDRVYAATVTLLFGTSAFHHRLDLGAARPSDHERVDHSMIFVFIAGTYAPIAALTLPRTAALAVLVVVGPVRCSASCCRRHGRSATPADVALLYRMGWGAVFVFPDLLRIGGLTAFVLLAAGRVT
jgi:hemolysin III